MTESIEKFTDLREQLRKRAEKSDFNGQFADLVLRWGNQYTFQPLPKQFRMGQQKICFANAYQCAKRHGVIYVEGYGSSPLSGNPVLHAWCVKPASNMVIDRTGRRLEYIGIPFQFGYVEARWNAGAISVIQDEIDKYPLLRMAIEKLAVIIVNDSIRKNVGDGTGRVGKSWR